MLAAGSRPGDMHAAQRRGDTADGREAQSAAQQKPSAVPGRKDANEQQAAAAPQHRPDSQKQKPSEAKAGAAVSRSTGGPQSEVRQPQPEAEVAAQTQPRLLEQSFPAQQPSRRGICSSQARRTPARQAHHWQAPRQQPRKAWRGQAQRRSLKRQVSKHRRKQVQQVRPRQQGQASQLQLDLPRLRQRCRARKATEACR